MENDFDIEHSSIYLSISSSDLQSSELLYKNKQYMQCAFYFTQSVEKLIKSTGLYYKVITPNETKDMKHTLLFVHKKILKLVADYPSQLPKDAKLGTSQWNLSTHFLKGVDKLDSLKQDLSKILLVSEVTENVVKDYLKQLTEIDKNVTRDYVKILNKKNKNLPKEILELIKVLFKFIYIFMCEFAMGIFTLYFNNNTRYPNFKENYNPQKKFVSKDFFIKTYPKFYKYQNRALIYFNEILLENKKQN